MKSSIKSPPEKCDDALNKEADEKFSYPDKDIKNRKQQKQHIFSFIAPDHRPKVMDEDPSPNAEQFLSSHHQKRISDSKKLQSQIEKQVRDESIDSTKMISHELKSKKMIPDESDGENEPSDDEVFDITYDDDNKLKKPTQISDASVAAPPKKVMASQDTKQPAAVVTTTDRSCLVRPGAHAIQGTMPEQPRPDVSLTNITTAYVVDDDDDNSDKLRLEEENKRLKQELEETHQQPLQLEEIPSAVVLPKRKIWHSRLGIILLIVVIISIGAVIVGVNLSKDNPEEKSATSEPPSRSLQPTFLPTQSSKPSSSSIPTLSPSKTNAPTSNPTMTVEPTITHSPTDPLTPNPTAFVRSVLTTTISQQFLQTYRGGVELMEMNQKQIDYFQSAISTYTQHFAPTDDVYLDVRTECLINEQVVISGSRNQFDSAVLLIIYFTVVYTSNDINVAEASYPDLFRNYMNSDEGKLRTRFNLQSQKVAVDDVDDVTIKEYSSLSPTAVPPEDASNRPTVLDNMPESLSPTTTVTVVVESMSPTTSMTAGRGTDPPTIIFGDRQDDDNFIPLPPPALEDDDPVQDPLNDDFVFRPPPPTPVAVTRSPVASPTLFFPLPPPGGFSPPFTEPPTTEQRRPTNIPTVVTAPQSVSQRFVQRYEGRPAALLERMTKSQIDYFQNILTDYTPIFASDDDLAERHEFVRTSCIFESQTLIIQERRRRRRRLGARLFIRGMQVETPPISFLNVEFTMTYTSNRINVTEYPIQFRNYMNFEEGNLRTLFNLQSVGMPIERIDNVLSLH